MATPREIREAALQEFRSAEDEFRKHRALQSVMLCVAQYWDDEANDAVHSGLVFSSNTTPTWPHSHDDDDRHSGPVHGDVCDECHDDFMDSYLKRWDDNGSVVDGFAAYCREHSHQNMDFDEAYLPYAIARRGANGVTIRTVGKLMRPWLDADEAVLRFDPQDESQALLELVYAAPFDAGRSTRRIHRFRPLGAGERDRNSRCLTRRTSGQLVGSSSPRCIT